MLGLSQSLGSSEVNTSHRGSCQQPKRGGTGSMHSLAGLLGPDRSLSKERPHSPFGVECASPQSVLCINPLAAAHSNGRGGPSTVYPSEADITVEVEASLPFPKYAAADLDIEKVLPSPGHSGEPVDFLGGFALNSAFDPQKDV